MCLKKGRVSYAWRLFIPRIAMVTALLVTMALWQVYRERNYHREFVEQQLGYVVERAANCYNAGLSIPQFLDFVHQYYSRHTFSRGIRVSIYETDTWKPLFVMGQPYRISQADIRRLTSDPSKATISFEELGSGESFDYIYRGTVSPDGTVAVLASVPMNTALDDYIEGNTNEVWIIAAIFALIIIVSEGFASWRIGRNIKILRDFAQRSTNDPDFVPHDKFPHDELGDIARQIVTMHNERLTARRDRDHEHEIALNAIREKARQKRQLTNNINHEIKTPIGVIKGYLDILADDSSLPDKTRNEFIAKARAYADRLINLVNDISAITRLDEGADIIVTEQVDYHDVVYTVSEDITTSGVLNDMTFSFDVPIGTKVKGNHALLSAMLLNLAKNSANYSHGTYCRLELYQPSADNLASKQNATNSSATTAAADNTDTANKDSDNYYYFRFYDDGIGVPPEHLSHIFQRFYRIESGRGRKSGGTGLGLAIVYNTITAHGGTIKSAIHPSGGLEIDFSLPKWRDNQQINSALHNVDEN